MVNPLEIRLLFLICFALGAFSCRNPLEKKTDYELDWMASEIEQTEVYNSEGQSIGILTVRIINNTKEQIEICPSANSKKPLFYLVTDSVFDIFEVFHQPKSINCPPLDTTFLFLTSGRSHQKIVTDNEVANLLPGKLYYWPDPKFAKHGTICDSIEIKKVANFHSATCPEAWPLYKKRIQGK